MSSTSSHVLDDLAASEAATSTAAASTVAFWWCGSDYGDVEEEDDSGLGVGGGRRRKRRGHARSLAMAFPEVSLKRRRRRASEISVASSPPSVPYSFSSFMAEQSCRILREYNLAFFRMSSSNSRSVTPCAADPFQMPTKPWGTWGLFYLAQFLI